MFARVQTVNQPAEKLDELAKVASAQLPAAHALHGFRGFYYLIDRDKGKALIISLWETEEDLRQLEAGNASTREQVKTQTGVESPASEIFEVALHAS